MEHAVTMVEDAEMRTLYFHQPRGRCGPAAFGRAHCATRAGRVAPVPRAGGLSDLLRAVVREMPTTLTTAHRPIAATCCANAT